MLSQNERLELVESRLDEALIHIMDLEKYISELEDTLTATTTTCPCTGTNNNCGPSYKPTED